ncbi:MAG: hypothetical protein ACT4PM_10425 [Gemmatimonadales bacterium]
MRRLSWAVLILALGCEGELFNFPIPGERPGTGQPPTPFTPSLAMRFGGSGTDLPSAIVIDPAGGFALAGTFTQSIGLDPAGATILTSQGGTDGFLARYTAAGALVWGLRFGGTRDVRVTALAQDAAGNLYVGGGFEGVAMFGLTGSGSLLNSVGGEDGFIAKYNASGTLIWARRFGGAGLDEVTSVAVDAAGNAYAGGVFNGLAHAFPAGGIQVQSNGESDGFVLALLPDGEVRGVLPIGGPQADAVQGIAVTSTGTLVVTGTFRSTGEFARLGGAPGTVTSLGGADGFIAYYAAGGLLERVRTFGSPADEAVALGGLALDRQDGLAILGKFSGSVDFEPGAAIVARTSRGDRDLFLARYDASGVLLSVATAGGTGGVTGARALVDANGTTLVVGSFSGSIDFDTPPASRNRTSFGRQGVTDGFAARYAPDGGLVWVNQFGESTALTGRLNGVASVGLDPAGNVILTGPFYGNPDFDPGSTAFILNSVGEADGFVIKLTAAGDLAPPP